MFYEEGEQIQSQKGERVREAFCDLQKVQYNRNIMQGTPNSKAGWDWTAQEGHSPKGPYMPSQEEVWILTWKQ